MRKLTTLFLSVLLCGMALAQEMPNMSPPKEMDKLKAFVGTWKGKVKLFDPGGSPPSEVDATINTSLTLGGRFLKSEFASEMPGMGPFTGLQLVSFDPAVKKYQVWWFDSMGDFGVKGDSTSTGPKFVFTTEEFEMPGMGKSKMRTSMTTNSATSFSMTVEMTMGDSWFKFLEGSFTKQ